MQHFLLLLLSIGALFQVSSGQPQTLITNTDISDYPTTKLTVVNWDGDGSLVKAPETGYELSEDGINYPFSTESCEADRESPQPRDIIFLIDNSPSVGRSELERYVAAVNSTSVMFSGNRKAVYTFGDRLTEMRELKLEDIDLEVTSLISNDASDLEAALAAPSIGLADLISRETYIDPNIIIFTDDEELVPGAGLVANKINNEGGSISLIHLGNSINQSQNLLVTQTGGVAITGVSVLNNLQPALLNIFLRTLYEKPIACDLIYTSEYNCNPSIREVVLEGEDGSVLAKDSFVPPLGNSELQFSPEFIDFGEATLGVGNDMTLTVTAVESDYTDVTIAADDPRVTITPSTISLLAGQSTDLTVTYTPSDSLIEYFSLTFDNDICPQTVIAGGGFNATPERFSINLLAPELGNRFLTATDTIISFENTGNAPVSLSLSRDGGETWELLAEEVLSTPYSWENISPPATDAAVIMSAIDLSKGFSFGTTIAEWENPFDLLNDIEYGIKDSVIAVAGNGVYILSSVDATLIAFLTDLDEKIICLDISPTQKTLAAGTQNGDIGIWNLDDMTFIRVIPFSYGTVTDILFSGDGEQLIASFEDGKLVVMDTADYSVETIIEDNNTRIMNIAKNPTDDFLIVTNETSQSIIYSMTDWTEQATLSFPISTYFSVGFAADNSLASVTSQNVISIFDPLDWTNPVVTLEENPAVNFVDTYFDPKGNAIVAIDLSGEIYAWDMSTWEKLNSFNAHLSSGLNVNGRPLSLDNSALGKTFVSTGEDGRVVIWGGLFNTLFSDTTDVFSIVEPELNLADIDLGSTLISRKATIIAADYLQGTTDPHTIIEKITIEGADADKFSLDLSYIDRKLTLGDSFDEIFNFKSETAGVFQAEIVLYYHGKTARATISAEAVAPALTLVTPIDFGTRPLGSTTPITVANGITNTSNSPIEITSMEVIGADNLSFTLINPPIGVTLAAGASIDYTAEFSVLRNGISTAQIELTDDTSPVPYLVNLLGTTPLPTITGFIGDIHGAPGDIVSLPITLFNSNEYFAQADTLSISLAYDSSLLTYAGDDFVQLTGKQTSQLLVQIERSELDTAGVVTIPLAIGLGRKPKSDINFLPNEENDNVFLSDGAFRLDSVCYEGPNPQLVNMNSTFGIEFIAPNPITDVSSIKVNAPEGNVITLSLLTAQGLELGTFYSDIIPADGLIDFDRTGIAAGFYIIKFETNGFVDYLKVIIQ